MTEAILLSLSLLAAVPAAAGWAQAPAGPDSTVYQLDPASRLVVKTGKAGLLGFAGHPHVIQAHAVRGELVYRPGRAASSLHLTLPTDSLEVLTPPDTEEIRKVTESTCRTSVRMDSVTFLISSVSGGVSTSRLSVGSVRCSEEAARPGR